MGKDSEFPKQAVILCAGLGTRLRPFTDTTPKTMLPVFGRPLLSHIVSVLKSYGVKEFFLNLHYLPDVIRNYFGDGSKFGIKINYSYENELLGSAGGLKRFEKDLDDTFLVYYGDLFNIFDYFRLFEFYKKNVPCLGVQIIGETEDPFGADLVTVDGEMRIKKLYQKPHKILPKEDFFSTFGVYLFNKKVLDYIPATQYYEIDHDLLPSILEEERYFGCKLKKDEFVYDIGVKERYNKVRN